MKPARLYIDGKWTEASSGAVYSVPNPATEEQVGAAEVKLLRGADEGDREMVDRHADRDDRDRFLQDAFNGKRHTVPQKNQRRPRRRCLLSVDQSAFASL